MNTQKDAKQVSNALPCLDRSECSKSEHAIHRKVAYFEKCEVTKGVLYAKSAFSEIYSIKDFQQTHEATNLLVQLARDDLSSQKQGRNMEPLFSMKHVRQDLRENYEDFEKAVQRLEAEATIMQHLNCRNISCLRGASVDGVEAYYGNDSADAYFLILDTISERLESKIGHWRNQRNRMRLFNIGGLIPRLRQTKSFLVKRLEVAHDIASALDHMHERRIAYKNFGLDKVGFDRQNCVKLVDLGDALKYEWVGQKSNTRLPNSRSLTTYTALEAHVGDVFAQKTVSYSFTKVLSELLTLIIIGPAVSTKTMNSYLKEFRQISCHLPEEMLCILNHGASQHPSKCPDMKTFVKTIELAINILAEPDTKGIHSGQRYFLKPTFFHENTTILNHSSVSSGDSST